MFSDKVCSSVEFPSTWKKLRISNSIETQTRNLSTSDASSQSKRKKEKAVQVEEEEKKELEVWEEDTPELAAFLHNIEPLIHKEIVQTKQSHAFDGYNTNYDEDQKSIEQLHSLSNPEIDEKMEVAFLSWSTTGSVIAAVYGRFDHENWCTHKSQLCTWNIDRKNINDKKPDVSIEYPCCLTTISFHPQKPGWIAGGAFDGEVILWDVSKEDDFSVATTGISEDSHRESVTCLKWIKDSRSGSKFYQLLSASVDGKILLWIINQQKKEIKLTNGFILLTENITSELRPEISNGSKEMGVSCLTCSTDDTGDFIIGSETGGLFKCSLNSEKPAHTETISEQRSSITLKSPVTFTFKPHDGPIYSVHYATFHHNLFGSSSMDQTARVYSVLQAAPIFSVLPNQGIISFFKWSITHPTLFSVSTEDGYLLFYDIYQTKSYPIEKLEVNEKKSSINTFQLNYKRPDILASGDSCRNIKVYKLSKNLTSCMNNEQEFLNNLASIF